MKLAPPLRKSSFTLPPSEVSKVLRIRKRLSLKSNTAVIRRALHLLEEKMDREMLRAQFHRASRIVVERNAQDMKEMDLLSDEGI